MKNRKFLLGIFVLTLVFGITVVGCPNEDKSTNGNSNNTDGSTTPTSDTGTTSFGNTMTLSGRVYLEEVDYRSVVYYTDGFATAAFRFGASSVTYTTLNSNITINCPYDGSGKVTNGDLSYTIGTPLNLNRLDFEYLFPRWDIVTSSRNVRGVFMPGILNDYNNFLHRRLYTVNVQNNNSYSETDEIVIYVYVENDVTVNAKGIKDIRTDQYATYTTITKDINLAFKAGWNTLYYKREEAGTLSGTYQNPTNINGTATLTVSMSNPSSLRWVKEESSSFSHFPIDLSIFIMFQTDEKIQGAWFNGDYSLYISSTQMSVKYVTDAVTPYKTSFTYTNLASGSDRYSATLPPATPGGTPITTNVVGRAIRGEMILFDYKTNTKIATVELWLVIENDPMDDTIFINSVTFAEPEYYYAYAMPRPGVYTNLYQGEIYPE